MELFGSHLSHPPILSPSVWRMSLDVGRGGLIAFQTRRPPPMDHTRLVNTLHSHVAEPSTWDACVCGVHFSTGLHDANQSMAVALDGDHLALEAEYSCKRSYSAFRGDVTRIRTTVTSYERCGMRFAPF